MGKYSEAFDAAGKRLRRESLFKIKPIVIRGRLHEPLICEKRMIRILEFKGTGEKRRFLDLVREIDEMGYQNMLSLWDGVEKPYLWIDEYIIQNNFQVTFEKDDVIVRPRLRVA